MTDHIQHGWDTQPTPPEQDFISAPRLTRTDKDLSVKEFYTFTDIESLNKKGRRLGLTVVTGGVASIYSALLTDLIIGIRDVTISRTVQLPSASLAGVGKIYIVRDISGSALSTTIAVSPTGTNTINGDTGTTISTNYGYMGFISDGNNWFIN